VSSANNKTTGVKTYRSVSKCEYKSEDYEKTTPTCDLRVGILEEQPGVGQSDFFGLKA